MSRHNFAGAGWQFSQHGPLLSARHRDCAWVCAADCRYAPAEGQHAHTSPGCGWRFPGQETWNREPHQHGKVAAP